MNLSLVILFDIVITSIRQRLILLPFVTGYLWLSLVITG